MAAAVFDGAASPGVTAPWSPPAPALRTVDRLQERRCDTGLSF
ncbi:MAG: hypothetical protein AB1730_23000 [Myxococcota bacterium]